MNAFMELIKEKEFDAISVNELCERAMVGRGTFYKHFADKYEFFSFLLHEKLSCYLEEAEKKINEHDPCSYYMAFFEAFIQFMEENNESFGPPTNRPMLSVMLFSTSDTIVRNLEDHLRMDEKNGCKLSMRPSSAARFLTGAMAQSARQLVGHSSEEQKKELTTDMGILIEKLYE